MRITEKGIYKFTDSMRCRGDGGNKSFIPKGAIFKVHAMLLNGDALSTSFSYSLSFDMPVEKVK